MTCHRCRDAGVVVLSRSLDPELYEDEECFCDGSAHAAQCEQIAEDTACNAACAEYGGHPSGPFCCSPAERADLSRVATELQVRVAALALKHVDGDARLWLESETSGYRSQWLSLRRRVLGMLDELAEMAAPPADGSAA